MRRVPVATSATLLEEADKAVCRVPPGHRGETAGCGDATCPKLPAAEPVPRRRHQQHPGGERRAEQDTGIFAVHGQPDHEADREPPDGMTGAQQSAARGQRSGPEKQQRRIGCDDDGAHIEHQRCVQQAGCARARALTRGEILGRHDQEQAAEQRRNRTQQADAQRGVAGDHGAGLDPERHHRRVIEIAGRQRLRPDPVIGLVGRERRASCDEEADGGDRKQQDSQPARDGQPCAPAATVCRRADASVFVL